MPYAECLGKDYNAVDGTFYNAIKGVCRGLGMMERSKE
jgi:hypothetical protein